MVKRLQENRTHGAMLRLTDFFQPRLQLRHLFSLNSELLTALEAMHMVRVLEPTQGLPEHRAALGVLALERHFLLVVVYVIVHSILLTI